jgi:murein DD-endopeptidase MepM/ murein hydrolase activator NlpD
VKSNKITYIFIPREDSKQRTVSLDYRIYILLRILFVLLILGIFLSYAFLIPSALEYRRYKTGIDSYKAQEIQLKQLLRDVNEMKEFNTYMRELVGLDLAAEYGEYSDLEKLIDSPDIPMYLSGIPELSPAKGIITKKFMSGPRRHYGIDIAGKRGDPVSACADGLVVFSGWTPELGNMVVISHPDDYISVYGHNDRLIVRERQSVKKGELIALLGSTGYSTGPHLHFEIWHCGHAIDPQQIIPALKSKN